MTQMNNAMDLFKQLKRTNCRECRVPSCLAFAAAVFRGEKRLEECPYVENSLIEEFHSNPPYRSTLELEQDQALEPLREQIAAIDFATSAERLGATLTDDKLTINCLGKDFTIDSQGIVTSGCHVHTWVTIPLINYVIHCKGKPLSGTWVPLRELKGGASWGALFSQRCEKPLKRLADNHTDLFEFMVQIFNAKPAAREFESDISIVLHPLPRVPMLICYWKPDDGLESSINVFFDSASTENLNIEAIYTLATGLVVMFEKIAFTHTERLS